MPKLAHDVFFTLADRNPRSIEQLVSACHKYLDKHDGVIDFQVGTREPELNRPVNQDFDVALRVVFADRAAHDVYQTAERHLQFIAEQKQNWAEVRIFDSNLA